MVKKKKREAQTVMKRKGENATFKGRAL